MARLKSLQTASDAGDLSYFSLAAGRPSAIRIRLITVDPSGATDHRCSLPTGGRRWRLWAWRAASKSVGGQRRHVLHPGESIYYDPIVPHQVRAYDNPRKPSSWLLSHTGGEFQE